MTKVLDQTWYETTNGTTTGLEKTISGHEQMKIHAWIELFQ